MLLAIPVFFICMGLEFFIGWIKKQKYYQFSDTITNLNIGIGNQVFSLFFKGLILGVALYFYENFALFYQPATWWSFVLCLFLYDFLYYWAHRWSHEVNFLWGAHIVHHQSEEFNLSVALRQSWFHNVLAFFIFMPVPLLGFDPVIFFTVSALVTFYQFWIHTKAIDKLHPVIEFIFNTPSHHRVHHGTDPQYIDKNHAATFIIWDRIFGTFQEEIEEPTYGITQPLKSWNPSWANFHYYVEMFEKAAKMSNWKDKVRMLVARPGWLPVELGGFQQPEKNKQRKFNKKARKSLNFYVAVQFLLLTIGLVDFMYHFDELSTFYQYTLLGVMLLTMMICGGILENKKWVPVAEYSRLILVMLSLNSLYFFWYIDWFQVMLIGSSIGFLILFTWFTLSLLAEKNWSKIRVGQ